jgi:hypothetical protein
VRYDRYSVTMELPEDVLAIVRAYSKPLFPYFKEYNRAMRVLGMKNWKALKEKLHSEPEHILPALFVYQETFIRKREVYREGETRLQLVKHLSDEERWPIKNQIDNHKFYAKRKEEDAFWLLVRLLYGDGKSYWDFREDML